MKKFIFLFIVFVYNACNSSSPEQPKENLAQELTNQLKTARENLRKNWGQNNFLGGKQANGGLTNEEEKALAECRSDMKTCNKTIASLEAEMKKNEIPIPEFKFRLHELPRRVFITYE